MGAHSVVRTRDISGLPYSAYRGETVRREESGWRASSVDEY
jgi:hypothetical protein